MAVEALAVGCAVLLSHALVHICRVKVGSGIPWGYSHLPTHSLPPVPVGRPEPLTLTHSAIGQLEARGAEALVGASRVLALASPAVALEVFTLIHVCRVTREEGSPWQRLPRTDTNGEGSRGPATCPRSLAPWRHHPLTKQPSLESLWAEDD